MSSVTRNTDFRYDLKLGEDAESRLAKLFAGNSTFEVKRDFVAHISGRVFIERESRGKESGLSVSEADYWVLVVGERGEEVFLIIPTDVLRRVERHVRGTRDGMQGKAGDDGSSFGTFVSLEVLSDVKFHRSTHGLF